MIMTSLAEGQSTERQSKAARFRQLLISPVVTFLMEAHNGLSAIVAEDAGFEALWASGLSMATALGVRDCNEASWTQVLDVLEFMVDATSVPILVDGDTGYGDFNNFRRLVKKLCQRQVAAVCIEDKLFPKTNSLLDKKHMLAEIGEFCGKIKAGKDSQTDPDFSVIARIEALIAGYSMEEALRRAEAYHTAGADGILIHSKKPTSEEIQRFASLWDNRSPLLIVPTTYYLSLPELYREAKISMCIWANHNLRAALSAMRDVSHRIFRERNLSGVEGHIASMSDLFEIVGEDELSAAEKLYLPEKRQPVSAIILAASRGTQLAQLTADRPKCMLDVRGEPILKRLTRSLSSVGIQRITAVIGYCHEAVTIPGLDKVINSAYALTGEITSLICAVHKLQGECIICYGDILFRDYILSVLLSTPGDIVLVVDSNVPEKVVKRSPDLVLCTLSYNRDYLDDRPVELISMSSTLERNEACGEWIGLVKLSTYGSKLIQTELSAMHSDGSYLSASLPDLFNRLVDHGHTLKVVYITGHWLDVNDAFDLAKARNFM